MEITKEIIEQCVEKGMSNKDTFTYLNISKSTLLRHCKTWGISFDRRSENLGMVTFEKINSLILKNLTLDQAAEELGVSRSHLAKKASEFKLSFSKQKFNLEEYLKLKDSGLKDTEIAMVFGMTPHGLYGSKVTHGLVVEDHNFEIVTKDEIVDLYVTKVLPISQIARILHKGITQIYELLKKHNIQLRREDGAHITRVKLLPLIEKNKSYAEMSESFRVTEDALKKAVIRNNLDSEELLSEDGSSLNRFTELQEQLIYGSLLGDCCIGNTSSNFNLRFCHGFYQKEYIEYKLNILKNYTNQEDIKETTRFDIRTKKSRKSLSFKTVQSKLFTDLYLLFYNPIKYVNADVLNKLDPRGLAFWFMDDGYRYNRYSLALCTESFSDEDLELIRNYFIERWSISCDIVHKRIIIRREEAAKFQNLIYPHILNMFKYKLMDIDGLKTAKKVKLDRDNPSWVKNWEALILNSFPYPKMNNDVWCKRVKALIGREYIFESHSYDILCNIFFPQMWDHLQEMWNNEKEKLLKNRIKYSDRVSEASLLTGLKLLSKETRTNFCPNLARNIISKLTVGKPSIILDYSSGFGGRLLGCFLSNSENEYHGIDPWDKNIKSSYDLINQLETVLPGCSKKYFSYNQGSENFIPSLVNNIDIAFSSPPYFDYEKYSLDANQSIVSYPIYSDWLSGYWSETVSNIYLYLRKEGTLALNISDVGGYSLCKDMVEIILSKGFFLEETLYFDVRSRVFHNTKSKKEPIYIFKKIK